MRRHMISLTLGLAATLAQGQISELQSAGFNSSFTLSEAQIASANLSASTAANIEAAVRFDQSQLANGGPGEDDFYTLPSLSKRAIAALKPGALLKVQEYTDPTNFTLPADTALSRILYTTTNLNGTVLPASAFVLWPFKARVPSSSRSSQKGLAPTVLWAHGTSGFFAPQAPSTHRALWYANSAPFALAQDGFAVVAPDYAGLGIATSFDGSAIPHQYFAAPAGAYDSLYALRAARAAFPGKLSEEFVAFGHSQGGGVAWGVAEALAKGDGKGKGEAFADLKGGYRGTIAASPVTNVFTGTPELILPWLSLFLRGVFPSFEPADWLTPFGITRTDFLRSIQGGISVSRALFFSTTGDESVYKPEYNTTWYVDAFARLVNLGSKPFAGPLLVMHGSSDPVVNIDITTQAVQETCAYLKQTGLKADLEYLVVNGTGHVPTLDAARPVWLQWIRDRFDGKAVEKKGCVNTELESFLPIERYASSAYSYLQRAGAPEYQYEQPLGV
ncbi:hypothetical protein GGR51DRAFT_576990 [Nemania sp. FL0031]|nr:hypothetical protein GGR51DRAFT_576990 [Nemania sp. FL0031]